MKIFIPFIFSTLFSFNSYCQDSILENMVTKQDSVLLKEFWSDFSTAVTQKDKRKLIELCSFPIYCRPCINDTTLKENNHVTIKVSKRLFIESQYKLFFEKPMITSLEKHFFDSTFFAHPYSNDGIKLNGFSIFYAIVAPSKSWEGAQGIISLQKKKGKYKITGVDMIP